MSSYPFQSPQAQASSGAGPYHHDSYANEPHHSNYNPSHPSYAHNNYNNPNAGGNAYNHDDSYDDQYQDRYNDRYSGNNTNDSDAYRYADAGARRMSYEKEETAAYGSSPYATQQDAAHANGGKRGIWNREDKGAFAQRSAPAKICRFLFGNLIIGLIIVISIICLIVIFLRPPNVGITGVSIPSQSGVTYSNGAFSFNVSVDISVSNPNSISAEVSKLTATAYDSTDRSTALGYGRVDNQKIAKNANTTISFPFQIKYNQSEDTDLSIIQNIASDCGLSISSLTGGSSTSSSSSGDLSFLLDIDVNVDVLSVNVPVSFAKNISFPCPLSASSLQSVLSNLGSAISGLGRRDETMELEERDNLERAALLHARNTGPVDLVAAAVDGMIKRYSPQTTDSGHRQERRTIPEQHDAL